MIRWFRIITAVALASVMVWVLSAAVCAEDSFSIKVRPEGQGLSVTAIGAQEGDTFKASINGGESFFNVNKLPFVITSLPSGTYQVCMLKNNSVMSEVKALCIGDSGIAEGREIELTVSSFPEATFKSGMVAVNINNYDEGRHYLLTLDGGNVWHPVKARKTIYKGLGAGTYQVSVRCLDDSSLECRMVDITVPLKRTSDRKMLKAALIKQNPELPTGCEVTSLAMAVNYLGISVSKTVLADHFLDKVDNRTGDFRKAFVGDPRKKDSYGCYSGVIKKTAVKFLDTVKNRTFDVSDISGCSPEKLYAYVDMGYPVIVWATNKMIDPVEGASWVDSSTGKTVTWTGNEHCMLLIGYDRKVGVVYINDPLYGVVSYKTDLFEKRFYELEQQAIVIAETTEVQ